MNSEQIADRILQFADNPSKSHDLVDSKGVYTERAKLCKRFKDVSENSILVTPSEKEKYDSLIEDPMHGYILDTIYDFMNMIFGKDQDTDEFWERMLFPMAARAFNYPVEKFSKPKVNLNALFFAFVFHYGLEIDFQSPIDLGKTEKPFTKIIKDIRGKAKVYGMRNVPYKALAEKYKDHRKNGKNELALKVLRMKMTITKFLDDKIDVTALAEIGEILLEEGLVDKAIEKTKEGLELIHPFHAEIIKFYCILLRAYYEKNNTQEADEYCFKAIGALDFHWGIYHPLRSTVYSILAYLLIKYKDSLEQAQTLYNASLIACTRVLGPNHLHTAEVHMDFGRLYLKMNNKKEALASFEKAYLIYEGSMESSIGNSCAPLASAALQLGTIMEDLKKLKEAFPYARKAADLYVTLYGGANEMYISSLWLIICIAFSLVADDVVKIPYDYTRLWNIVKS